MTKRIMSNKSNIGIKYNTDEVNFRVSIAFDYTINPVPGDPDDHLLLAEQEKEFLFSQLRTIPGIVTENLHIGIATHD